MAQCENRLLVHDLIQEVNARKQHEVGCSSKRSMSPVCSVFMLFLTFGKEFFEVEMVGR